MAGWTCGTCGTAGPAASAFCGSCGSRRPDAPTAPGWQCRSCGTGNPPASAFCGGCGTSRPQVRQEELRLVTSLFADISGFTTLADALDTEELHEVVSPLVRGLTEIAEQYGGFVEKYAGDALLVVYGAPVTHEDDPQRALLTALEMHARLPELLAPLGPGAAHLTVHVGVNTGRVIARQAGSAAQSDYAVLGDSVILAQRLESVCPSGQTYVGASTQALCAQEFDFEDVGLLALKGKAEPVQAYRLVGRRRADSAAVRPLVGRDAELAVVDALLERGRGRLHVVGEPGVGKSRLLAEVQRRATGRGARWLAARCLSYGAALPYWPVRDLLRAAAGVASDAPPDLVAQRVRAALPEQVVEPVLRLLGAAPPAATPELARQELHAATTAWLRSLTASGPVVLLVEDVHWADPPTRELLAEVERALADEPLLLLLSTREATGSAEELRLGPLDEPAVAAVVQGVLAAPAGDDLAALLSETTGGNPLFVEELARSLHETGALVATSAGLQLRAGWDRGQVPTSVEQVFATRLDALPPPVAAVLQTASVVGRTVPFPLLRAVAAPDDVEEAVAALVAAGLLERGRAGDVPTVVFSHALLQEVVSGRLLRRRRRELHRRVADVARELYGDGDDDVDLLARHLYLAEAGEESVGPLLRAGRRAASLYANAAAVVHLSRARDVLHQLDDAARLDEVELELGGLLLAEGRAADAVEAYDAVRVRTDRAEAWAGAMAARRNAADYTGVVDLWRASRHLDLRDPGTAAVWAECANALVLAGRASDAVVMLRTALRRCPSASDAVRGRLLTQLAYVEGEVLSAATAVRHVEEALSALEQAGDVRQLVAALRVAGMAHARAGDPATARLRLQRGSELAGRTGLLAEAAGCLLNSALLVLEERPQEAAEGFAAAEAGFERIGHAAGRAQAAGNLADALCRAGRLDEAETAAARAVELATGIGHLLTVADVTATRARVLLAREDWSGAADRAEEAARLLLDLDDHEEARDCLELAAGAAERAGERARAESLRARSAALAG